MRAAPEVRAEARRIMLTVRRHAHRRRYGESPHQNQNGCTLTCFPDTPTRDAALRFALDLEAIGHTPQDTYLPGWMRPVR